MTFDITLEQVGTLSTIAAIAGGTGAALLALWSKSKFVTRREWHDQNDYTAGVVASLQLREAQIGEQLRNGEKVMEAQAREIQETRLLVNESITQGARIEGLVTGLHQFLRREN